MAVAFIGVVAVLGEPWAASAAQPIDARELAARIDARLDAAAERAAVRQAEAADDAEFFRRLSLDITGRIPTVAEARAFLDDSSPDKRTRTLERLLAGPGYVRHFARTWRTLLLAQANAQDLRYLAPKVERWLERQLFDDVPYDAWVRKLVTAPLDAPLSGRLSADDDVEAYAVAFLQANELKPENLAAATSRMFLGVNLDCAQCHNHPFADWKQEQFWQLAAFYGGVKRLRADNPYLAAPEAYDQRRITIAGTEKVVEATFLDGRAPAWTGDSRPRNLLADWVTADANPYFARSAVNRMWAHFFGIGLVDPLDDLGGRTPPAYPELLDELAAQFTAHDYDAKYVIRTLTQTKAYGRTSRVDEPSLREGPHFSRMRVRGLSAEQVYDSLATAVGVRQGQAGERDAAHRAALLTRFSTLDRPTEAQTTITQALSLMNGEFVREATDPTSSPTLVAVAEAPFLDRSERIESLFLATLSRRPSADEAKRMEAFVAAAGDERTGLGDLFWALLNSGEFLLNR